MSVPHPPLLNAVRLHRESVGLSQSELARRVGVSRQAINAIEAGRQVPTTSLALLLSRALGCSVDDLFQLSHGAELQARLATSELQAPDELAGEQRAIIGRVDGEWVAHPLWHSPGTAADGLLDRVETALGRCRVSTLAHITQLENNALVAGCAPLLGVLADSVQRRYRNARATWLPHNTERALELFAHGLIHVAGIHLLGGRQASETGELQRRLPQRGPLLVVNLTQWRQGLVVRKGNPLGIRDGADLVRPGVRLALREPGAAAGRLLQRLLHQDCDTPSAPPNPALAPDQFPKVPKTAERPKTPKGIVVTDHHSVARLVACDAADVGIAIESVALQAGLDFIPLSEERFDLVMAADAPNQPALSRMLDVLGSSAFVREAAALRGYDASFTGQATLVSTDGGAP